jgi:FemAB-related protein (PEP-CTERM system-associated)
MRIDVRADVPDDTWNTYVDGHPEASIYHRAEWGPLMMRAFGRRVIRLAAEREGRIVGVLPLVAFDSPLFGRFTTSMPFLNYGGVLADGADVGTVLLAAAIEEARRDRSAYLELRHTRKAFADLTARTHKVAMLLPLQASADAQWQALDRKVRNQVRKAEKSSLTLRVGGEELLAPFHQVLARNMRDLGSPVHAPRFFREILASFPDAARILCLYQGATPVAASFVLKHRRVMEVPWASTVRDYNALCANVLLYWEMLKFAIEGGCDTFDFGRSTPHESTYRFKAQWGAEPHPLVWEYWTAPDTALPDRSPSNPRFSAAVRLWSRLPLPIANVLGPLIVRHIP